MKKRKSATQVPKDPGHIGLILAYLDVHGPMAAARMFGFERGTGPRMAKKYKDDEAVQEAKRQALERVKSAYADMWVHQASAWAGQTHEARVELLERVMALAMVSDNLHDIVGALKLVHDANLSERIYGRLNSGNAGAPAEGPGVIDFRAAANRLAGSGSKSG